MIPRLVHRLWLGSPEPEWLRGFAAGWRRPGWELWQWGDDDVAALFPLTNQDVYDRAEEIAPANVGQLRADVLRYELLYRFGGVYVDADFECLRPIDGLLEADCFAAWEVQDRWAANGIMGATLGHPFIARLIDGLEARVVDPQGRRPNRLTGPHYLTTLARAHPEEITVFPQDWFFPYGWREIRERKPGDRWPKEALAVHHWLNQRCEQGVPVA